MFVRRGAVIFLVGLLLGGSVVLGQTSQSVTQPAVASSPTKGYLDQWRDCTVSFGMVEQDQFGQRYYRAIGTGVVFLTAPQTGYIITAKHVFFEPAKNYHPNAIQVRFSFQQDESVYKQFAGGPSRRLLAGWVS